jgi:hypothetical protein
MRIEEKQGKLIQDYFKSGKIMRDDYMKEHHNINEDDDMIHNEKAIENETRKILNSQDIPSLDPGTTVIFLHKMEKMMESFTRETGNRVIKDVENMKNNMEKDFETMKENLEKNFHFVVDRTEKKSDEITKQQNEVFKEIRELTAAMAGHVEKLNTTEMANNKLRDKNERYLLTLIQKTGDSVNKLAEKVSNIKTCREEVREACEKKYNKKNKIVNGINETVKTVEKEVVKSFGKQLIDIVVKVVILLVIGSSLTMGGFTIMAASKSKHAHAQIVLPVKP